LEQEETSSGFRFARRFFCRRSNAFDALSRDGGKRAFLRFSLFFPLLGGASATFFAFFLFFFFFFFFFLAFDLARRYTNGIE
jgi:hypothetical protein